MISSIRVFGVSIEAGATSPSIGACPPNVRHKLHPTQIAVWLFCLAIGIKNVHADPQGDPESIRKPSSTQLSFGQTLIERLVTLSTSIPLSQPSDVYRLFGVEQVQVFPSGLIPRAGTVGSLRTVVVANRESATERKLLDMGATNVAIRYRLDKESDVGAFGMDFVKQQACVHVDDVLTAFRPLAANIKYSPNEPRTVTSGPVVNPGLREKTRNMEIDLSLPRSRRSVTVTFSFDDGICADGVGIRNSLAHSFSDERK